MSQQSAHEELNPLCDSPGPNGSRGDWLCKLWVNVGKIWFWIVKDDIKPSWKVVGKTDEQHGFAVEIEFKYESDALQELYWLQRPELRPRSK